MAIIIGKKSDNKLVGTKHNDLILGLGGDDTLSGGDGNDTIFGGNGNDSIAGGAGKDWIVGGKHNDTIDGGTGNDTIFGGDGNDSISGGSGDDVIYGDDRSGGRDHDDHDNDCHDDHGNKLARGWDGRDDDHDNNRHHDRDASRNDTILGGDGKDWIDGGRGNDSILGGAGNDTISGGSGDDTLVGGSGADQLTGGSGQDHFVYLLASDSPKADGWDRIFDFTQGQDSKVQDKIDLAAFRGADDLIWKGEDPAVTNPWDVWYHNDDRSGSTFIFADTSGDGTADLKIELKHTPGLDLVVTDFIGVSGAQVDGAPTIDIQKTVDANGDGTFSESESVQEGGVGTQTADYRYVVTNTSPAGVADPLTITSLVDNQGSGADIALVTGGVLQAGVTLTKTDGDQDALLETGETWTYVVSDVTVPLGNVGGSHVNTATVNATDDEGTAASDSDTATVTYTNVAPTITVVKTVDVSSDGNSVFTDSETVNEGTAGLTADYRYAVANTSATSTDPVTLTTLLDDEVGNILSLGTVISKTGGNADAVFDPGETWTYEVTGVALPVLDGGASHVNNVEAQGVDDEGTSTNLAEDSAAVTAQGVAPTITVVKTVDVSSDGNSVFTDSETVNEGTAGLTADYRYAVANTSATSTDPVTLTTLLDDEVGNILSLGTVISKTGGNADAVFDPGETWTYEVTGVALPVLDGGASHVNNVEAQGVDDEGTSTNLAEDSAAVTAQGVAPTITVVKTVDVSSDGNSVFTDSETVNEGTAGLTADYRYAVANTSATSTDPVTLTTLLDDEVGNILSLGTVISKTGGNADAVFDPGETWTYEVTGVALPVLDGGASHVNNVEAQGVDDEGTSTNLAEDSAAVTAQGVAPTITVVKTVDADEDGIFHESESVFAGGVSGGTDATDQKADYTYVVTNTSPAVTDPLAVTSLVDDRGTVSTGDDIDVLAVGALVKTGGNQDNLLEAGETWTYTVNDVALPTQNAGSSLVNTATVNAVDDEDSPASDTDTATVTYANVAPTINIQKTVDANEDGTFSESESVQEGGVGTQTADYRYVLTNTSAAGAQDPLTLTSLIDDRGTAGTGDDINVLGSGTLSGDDGDGLLEAGETWTYAVSDVTVPLGNVGGSHVNTATVNATDDEGTAASDSDTATVTYTNVAPTITVVKTVDANGDAVFSDSESVSEGGVGMQTADYKFVITNTSPASTDPVTLTSIGDSELENLLAVAEAQNSGNPIVLDPGASFTFYRNDFVVPVRDADTSFVNNVSVQGKDNDDTLTNLAGGSATVTYTNVAPTIDIQKTVDANEDGVFHESESVFAGGLSGGTDATDQKADYTYVVTNTSPASTDPLEVTSLVDDRGTVSTGDDIDVLAVGTVVKTGGNQDGLLDSGETWTYTVNDVALPTQNAGSSLVNTATVNAMDNEGGPASDTDTATVTYVNAPPIANGDFVLTNIAQGTEILIPAVALLFNDADLENDPLSITTVANPATGDTVSLSSGSPLYTDNGDEDGSFDYKTFDGTSESELFAHVTVDTQTGNTVNGTGASEILIGGSINDRLNAGSGADFLFGNAGNDTIRGGAGDDTLDGGAGSGDLISFADSTTAEVGINFTLFQSSLDTVVDLTSIGLGTDTYRNIEGVIGTNYADVLTGTDGNDTLAGGETTDTSNDTLLGGAGNDSLRQTLGSDSIDGGDGSDSLSFFTGIVYNGAVGVNVDLVAGNSDADASTPGDVAKISSIEFVTGNFGNDVFIGGDPLHAPGVASGPTEFFQPLGGNDTITGAPGRGWSAAVDYSTNTSSQPVTVVLGNSDNVGSASDGFGFTDTLTDVDYVRGGAGNDSLVGGSYSQGASGVFVEAFRGNAGNDAIDGGGSDTVIGSYGVTDRAEYNNSPSLVVVNLGTAPISGNFYGGGVITVIGGTALDGFDSAPLTPFVQPYTDTLDDINTVRGSNFNDTLIGGNPKFDNNERFEGLAGNDFIDGGSGNDEADYSSSLAAVVVNLGAGTASDGFGGTDTLVSVERARGGSGNDTLIGGANALESLMGNIGNDLIDGGSMTGVNYAAYLIATTAANATISGGSGTAADGQGGTDTLVNINGLWGSNFNDALTGGLGDQWFRGSGGNDLIDGGADTDTASYAADPNGVIVNLSGSPIVVGSETVAGGTARDGWGGIWNMQGNDTLSGIENVEGSSFNDTLIGNDGDNVINGKGDSDSLVGGAGNDTYRIDPEEAQEGDALKINDASGIDRIVVVANGGDLEEINVERIGDDLVIAGGIVTVQNHFTTDTVEDLQFEGGASVFGYQLGTGTYNLATTLTGGSGDDVIAGTSGGETLDGGSGNDLLFGNGGNDSLIGGDGNDLLVGGAGQDTVNGGNQDDVIVMLVTAGNVDEAHGGSNTANGDTLALSGDVPGDHVVVVELSAGDQVVLIGGMLDNTLMQDGFENVDGSGLGSSINATGDGNANMLTGSNGNDTLSGGGGNDLLVGGLGQDTVNGGVGNDTIVMLVTAGNVDVADGGAGNDTLALSGVVPNYTLIPNQNFVLVDLSSPDQVLAIGGLSAVDVPVQQNFENLDASGLDGRITATGGSDNVNTANIFIGSNGNDGIIGGGGNDTIRGGAGDDYIDGGAGGGDRIDFSDATGGINFTLHQGTNPGDLPNGLWSSGPLPGIGTDSYKNIEGVFGTDFADTLTGSGGNDVIRGNGGDDLINSGGGNDTIRGGDGNDTIDGGGGGDLISFADATGGINFTLNQGADGGGFWSSGALPGIGTDSYKNIEGVGGTNFNDTLTGSSSDDTLRGSAGDDTIDGDAGNDLLDLSDGTAGITFFLANDSSNTNVILSSIGLSTGAGDTYKNMEGVIGTNFADSLTGSSANDVIRGGGGNDTIDGGAGVDLLDFSEVSAGFAFTLGAGGSGVAGVNGSDTYSNMEGMIGGIGNDTLTGNAGDNLINGGAGNDTLFQTQGNDSIDGGADFDRLVFTDPTGASTTGVTYVAGGVGVSVNLAEGDSDYDTSDAFNPVGTLASIENVTGTIGNDSFVGGDSSHAPDFLGSADTEAFRPLGGSDSITGGAGTGFNTRIDYSTNTSAQAVIVNLGAAPIVVGIDTVQGGTARDGFGFTDYLLQVDQVYGGSGNDMLVGGSQERANSGTFLELFRGNLGSDTIDGAGTDTVVGAAGRDRADYGSSPAAVIVNLSAAPVVVGTDTVLGGTARDGFGFTDFLFNIDQVQGSNSNDTLVGGGTDHRLIGGAGNDMLVGATSGVEASYQNSTGAVVANLATGTASDGQGGTDTLVNIGDLRGSSFDDILIGNAADNSIDGNPGADIIDGGGGIDFASYLIPLATGGVNAFIENGAGSVNDGSGSMDTLTNIEGLIGSNSNDMLAGGLGDQWFIGRGGSDVINGGADTDTVSYRLDPAGVIVNLSGSPIVVGSETVTGGTARDGWGGIWNLQGNDTLSSIENVEGSSFNDTLIGNDGDNVINGRGGSDSLVGGAGNDTYRIVPEELSGTDAVRINDASGADHLVAVTNGQGVEDVVPVFFERVVNDLVIAGGAVTVQGHFSGQAVEDLRFEGGASAFGYALGTGTYNLGIDISSPLDGTTVQDVIAGSSDVEVLNGLGGNDLLFGNGGDDTLNGGDGDDLLVGGVGPDSVDGGSGDETIVMLVTTGNVDEADGGADNDTLALVGSLGGGTAIVNLSVVGGDQVTFTGDTLVQNNFENLDASGLGSSVNATGSGGDNNIVGSNGNDTIDGGAGNDTIKGGSGSDSLAGGLDTDTLLYDDSPTRVIVNLRTNTEITVDGITVLANSAVDGFGSTDAIGGFENVIGSAFNDFIQGLSNLENRFEGGAGNDTLAGSGVNEATPGAMDDTLLGGAGNDVLRQSRGNDSIDGGADFDRLEFVENGIPYGGAIGVNVNLGAGTSDADPNNGDAVNIPLVNGRSDIATVSGIEYVLGTAGNDSLTGDANANRLEGQGGNDTLDGAAGNDTITGGGGTDTQSGGTGSDTFDFNATSESSFNFLFSDTITDFVHGTDKIDLSDIDANTSLGGDQAFLFGGNNGSAVANSVTWGESLDGKTHLQIDVNGDTIADMHIILEHAGLGLTDADFIL